MSSRSCAALCWYVWSSTSAIGRVASALSCSRALEYLPTSTYTSASSRRGKKLCGLQAAESAEDIWGYSPSALFRYAQAHGRSVRELEEPPQHFYLVAPPSSP